MFYARNKAQRNRARSGIVDVESGTLVIYPLHLHSDYANKLSLSLAHLVPG